MVFFQNSATWMAAEVHVVGANIGIVEKVVFVLHFPTTWLRARTKAQGQPATWLNRHVLALSKSTFTPTFFSSYTGGSENCACSCPMATGLLNQVSPARAQTTDDHQG